MTIYDTTKSDLVNYEREMLREDMRRCAAIKPEFGNESKPDYIQFVADVEAVEHVRPSKLYGIWFVARTFRDQWNRAHKDSVSQIAFITLHWELRDKEITAVLVAWMRHHGRRPGAHEIKKEITDTINRVRKDVEPSLAKRKAKVNAKRRQRRIEKNKKKGKNTTMGRPIEKDGLRAQILAALQDGRSTPALLAEQLDATRGAVDCALLRMVKTEEVSKVGRGLYSLPPADMVG